MGLHSKALELFQETLEPLMIVINYDACVTENRVYTKQELLGLALAMHLDAMKKGKTIEVDLKNKIVVMK